VFELTCASSFATDVVEGALCIAAACQCIRSTESEWKKVDI